jgi:hypothetical protein
VCGLFSFSATAPLPEEEGHISLDALIANFRDPAGIYGSRSRARFTAYDRPIDITQIQLS